MKNPAPTSTTAAAGRDNCCLIRIPSESLNEVIEPKVIAPGYQLPIPRRVITARDVKLISNGQFSYSMSADIRRLFPGGLKPDECERGKPRHDPPLRFNPPALPTTEEGEEEYTKTITVELTAKTHAKLTPHSFRNVEDFLAYQKMHDYVLSQQSAKANWESLEDLMPAAVAQYAAIPANTTDPAEKKQRKKFKEVVTALKKRQDSIMTKSFTLYQQMSGPALRAEWIDIVGDHCFSTGWLLLDGTPSLQERG